MLVNAKIIENLSKDAGEERTKRAKNYKNLGRVKITNTEYENSQNFTIQATVIGSEIYKTYVAIRNGEVEDITCNCQDYYNHYGVCKHSLATVMEFSENSSYPKKEETKSKNTSNYYRNFKQIVSTFYNEEVEEIEQDEETVLKNKGTINLEPHIIYDKFSGDMKVEFKIGDKKLYKIKNLAEFYTRMAEKEFYQYGEKLQFIHTKEMFTEESKPLLDFLLQYAEIIRYANSNSNSNYRYYGKALSENSIILGNSGMDDLFEVLKGKQVIFQKDYNTEEIELTEEEPKIEFRLEKIKENQYSIIPNIEIFNVTIIKGKNYKYLLMDKKLHRVTKEFEKTKLKLLEVFRQNYMTEVLLGKEELTSLFSIIMPKVNNAIIMGNVTEEEIAPYKPKELEVKVYLDYDKHDFLTAEVKFLYGEQEFNPLNEKEKIDFPRNMIQEAKALNAFRKTGFMLDSKNLQFILPDNDKIYEFLTKDINFYMQKFEVLATEKFKTKQIREPKLGKLGVKVENDLLSIDLKNMQIDTKELKEIMEKYELKKKYHRLRDGSFLDLQENQEIEFLDKLVTGMNLDYQELESKEVHLPVNRSLYLEQLLKGIKGTEISKNNAYKEIINGLNKDQLEEMELPKNLEPILRYYQKTGFKWLKTLDNYRFGGILADDMGLRKNHTNVISNC